MFKPLIAVSRPVRDRYTAQNITILFQKNGHNVFVTIKAFLSDKWRWAKGKRKKHLMFSMYHLCQLLQPISWICFCAQCVVTSIFWQSFLFEKCSSVLEGEDYLQLWKFCWNFLTLLQELQGGSFTFMISPTSLLWKKRCLTFIFSKLKFIPKLHLQLDFDYFTTPMK